MAKKSVKSFRLRKGFTLVEMLIVLGILGVVATTVIMGINPLDQLRKSNDADRKNDLAQLQKALELYYQDNGAYPPSSADFKIRNGTATVAWGSAWQPYMATLPKDPVAAKSYQYYSPPTSNGQTYYIYANLERGAKDPQVCNAGNACTSLGASGFPPATSCGGACNYGVSSPNVTP
jgi:type II secretion system protein G